MKRSYIIYLPILVLVIAVIYLNKGGFQNEIALNLNQEQDSQDNLILSNVANQTDGSLTLVTQQDYQQELVNVKQELSNVKAEVAILKRMIAQQSLQKTQAVLPKKLATTEKDLIKSSQEESHKAIELIDASFRQQTKNEIWSKQSEQTLQNALVAAKLTAQGNPVIDCRVSMCRVELSTEANQELALEELPALVGSDFPNMRFDQVIEKDGTVTTVVYMSKDEFNHEATGG